MDYMKFFKNLLFLLCCFFFFIYGVGGNGFYEYKLSEKKYLTEEQIAKFEDDINNNVNVDVSDYLMKEKNTDNFITNFNRKISSYINTGFEKFFKYIFDYIDSSS